MLALFNNVETSATQIQVQPTVEFIDSKIDNDTTYIVIDGDCPVRLKKNQLDDFKKIVDQINADCDMNLKVLP